MDHSDDRDFDLYFDLHLGKTLRFSLNVNHVIHDTLENFIPLPPSHSNSTVSSVACDFRHPFTPPYVQRIEKSD